MTLPLTEELIRQIIFAMEDQRHRFVLDAESGEMMRDDELPVGEGPPEAAAGDEAGGDEPAALDGVAAGGAGGMRFLRIPSWGPAEGFHLMERFVLKLRNPIFAEMLREALSSGQGVFRRFKDIVRKNREIERLWLAYKDREMRRVVEQWYESERELAGLERRAAGTEPPLELVASEVSILRGEARHVEPALKLDQKVRAELRDQLDAEAEDGPASREDLPPLLDRRSLFFAAELAGGEFAGFVWAVEEDPASLRLEQVAVRKHFRGIGLGTQLLRRLLQEARDLGYRQVLAPLRGADLSLSPLFESLGFSPAAVELACDLGETE